MEEISRERAQALMREGDLEGAVAVLKEVTAQNPGDAMAWQMMGAALGALGNTDESIGAFQQAAELQPTSARVQFNLAVALVKSDRTSEARSHLEKALALDPGYEQARAKLKEIGGIAPDTVTPPPPDPTLGGGPAAKPAAPPPPAPVPPPPPAAAPPAPAAAPAAPPSLGGIGAPAAPKPAAPVPPAPPAAPAGISLQPIGGGLAPIGGGSAAPAPTPPPGTPAPGGMAGLGGVGGTPAGDSPPGSAPPARPVPPPSAGPGSYAPPPGAYTQAAAPLPSSYSGPAIDAPPAGSKLATGIGLALLFGAIGCAIWWGAVIATGFIGFRALIATGVGWVIGYGVRLGVGHGGATQAATAAIIAGVVLVPNLAIMLFLAPGIIGGIFSVLGVAWGIQQAYKVAGTPD